MEQTFEVAMDRTLRMPENFQRNFESLWDMSDKAIKKVEANHSYTMDLGAHLEGRIAETSHRVVIAMTAHREEMEDRLDTMQHEFMGTIEQHGHGFTKEIEDLRRQLNDIQGNITIGKSSNSIPNHHPFVTRYPVPQTPASSTSGRQGAFGSKQSIDVSEDFLGMDEFGDDLFATPEGRREEYDRRVSLGGGSIFNAILAPAEASNTYMISSVTRGCYSQVLLRDISLDSVGPFMNQYLNIKRKHPGQAWMMVDFCSEYTKQELTVLADTHELPGAALGLGGAFALTDKQVLFLILEKLKARSMDDFITRLQGIRFLEEDSDLDFTKQHNYEKLFRAALNFRFRFVMRVQLLGGRSKAEYIPPLHKTGQTPGLLNYFFDAWPAGTGKALFSRHFTPEMRAQTNLKSFFKLFFAQLNTYRDVKQGYDDLGSVLSSQQRDREGDGFLARSRDEKTNIKRESFSNATRSDSRQQEERTSEQREHKVLRPPGYEAHKKLWTPDRERRDFRPRMLQHIRVADDELESRDPVTSEWNQTALQREMEAEREEEFGSEGQFPTDDAHMVNAIDGERSDKKKGCYWKYMYGECTNKDCTMDHRDDTIQGMWKKKVWDLAKAVKSPGSEVLVSELQRALRDAHSSTNSNTRA